MDETRDELIDILLQKPNKCTFEELGDYLLANNVVRLPCKVGDMVYRKDVLTVKEEMVIVIGFDNKGMFVGTNCGTYQKQHFGKNIFFTREAAKKALEEK